MPHTPPTLWVLAINRSAFDWHITHVVSQMPNLQDMRIAIVSESNLRGRRFEPGDVLHTLQSYALREDALQCEQAIAFAKLTWIPETWWFVEGKPTRSTAGTTPPPPLHNTSELERWLATP